MAINVWNEIKKPFDTGYNFLKGIWDDFTGVSADKANVESTNAANAQNIEATNQANKEIQDSINKSNIEQQNLANQTNLNIANQTNKMNYDVAMQNLGFQRELQEYNKALQQQMFEREDTSYQRTARDMLAAGLNPLSMQGTNGSGEAIALSPLNNSFQAQQASPMAAAQSQAVKMQAAQFQAFQSPNRLNDFVNLVSSVIGNVEQLRTGKLQRDSLQQQMDINKVNSLLSHIEKGIYLNDDGKVNIDDDLYDTWLNDIKETYRNKQKQREHEEREWKHQEETGKFETDTDFEKILTAVSDWLIHGRAESYWKKLTEKYPLLNVFNEFARSLFSEPKIEVHSLSRDGHL